MAQRHVRTQQATVVGQLGEVFLEHLLRVHDGAYLQQIELAGTVGREVAGKLYLHRTAHSFLSEGHRHLQYLWQGEHSLLKHAAETDYLASAIVETVADNLVIGIEGGGYIVERMDCLLRAYG